MGTFWWILVMIALVAGIALAYAAILKRMQRVKASVRDADVYVDDEVLSDDLQSDGESTPDKESGKESDGEEGKG